MFTFSWTLTLCFKKSKKCKQNSQLFSVKSLLPKCLHGGGAYTVSKTKITVMKIILNLGEKLYLSH